MTKEYFKNILFNRKSIKVYDKNFKISNEEILEMIDEAVSAPSSVNFQPWRFVVVNSEKGKEILSPLVKYNPRQNNTSSAMIVIFGDKKCQEFGDEIYQSAVDKGYMPQEIKDKILPNFINMYNNLKEEDLHNTITIDCSLVAMQLMLVAEVRGYSTNAIGGFDSKNIAEKLGLDKNRYLPILIIAIGKKEVEGRETYRLSSEKITKFI